MSSEQYPTPEGEVPSPAAEHHDDYGPSYFENYSELRTDPNEKAPPYRCGEPVWEESFRRIATQIVARLSPATALDAGCAIGFLVQALRAQGVAAEGVDVSTWAISQVPEEVAPFCRVGSLVDELSQVYDLITCIEVLEHLPAGLASDVVANLCRNSRVVLFSSTPDRFDEVTHVNVQPSEYWVDLFARCNFYRDVDFDASFVSPHAILFRPASDSAAVAASYERWAARMNFELAEVRKHRDLLYSEVWGARQAAEAARAEVVALFNTKTFRATKPLRSLRARLRRRSRES
ncbi:MAG TPA: class I SAM-dependent methyltransferase [Candidatus Dormibacteraeota bacterium]